MDQEPILISVYNDQYFMKQAYLEAQKAFEMGEIPVGVVIVCNQKIIAKSYNLTEQLTDVTAHAEIMAITAAANYLGSKYLDECEIFCTLEPCVMCAGALYWARPKRLVFGADDPKRGFMVHGRNLIHPTTKLEFGVMHDECSQLMTQFFAARRK